MPYMQIANNNPFALSVARGSERSRRQEHKCREGQGWTRAAETPSRTFGALDTGSWSGAGFGASRLRSG